MRLLKQYENKTDAEALSERLRKKGVLTYISSQQSRSLSSFYTGALRSGVWVVLENQYTDAFALLHFNQHKVEYPLTEEEMHNLEGMAKNSFSESVQNTINKTLAYIIGIVIFLLLALIGYLIFLY